jgi:hypothetical protein
MNRLDFYQAEWKELTVPAGMAVVFIEGRLYPYLEVVEIIEGGMGEFGSARMAYNPAADSEGQKLSIEELKTQIGTGKAVSIKWLYNANQPAGGAEGLVIFAGQVEEIETRIGPDGERVEIVARDFSAALERITVFGQRVRDIDGRVVTLDGAGTIFNEGGEPNASGEVIEDKGSKVRPFAAQASEARWWDSADIVRYLLCEYVPAGQLGVPDESRLRAIASAETVRDLDVNGMSLLGALQRCCEQAGLRFKFVPRFSESGPEQAIVFYRQGKARQVELNLQQYGQRISVSKTNIWKATGRRESPMTRRYVGLGDYKVFEASFDLIKGWPWYDEDLDYEKFSPSTNPEFYKVKDTWRKWCLNETGDYTDEPFTQGPAYDFSPIFGTDKYVHRRRRFWPALSCDVQGRSLGYFLEVSYDSGNHWWQYMYAFDNLLDECGIWLASDRLDIYTWVAAIKGSLRVRITASVVSDERLRCTVADGPLGSTVPVVERVIEASGRFKYRKVTSRSIFRGLPFRPAPDRQDSPVGPPDERDDTAALYQFVRRQAEASQSVIETFEVHTPYLALGFEVGDRVVNSPDDRDIFSTTSDSRSTAVIERVRMDFRRQTTQLKVVRRRM